MPTTIRFPQETGFEATQVITILNGVATIPVGGGAVYTDFDGLKIAGRSPGDSPYISLVIEFTATAAVTIGDGVTQTIGLYGEIDHPGGSINKYLLGALGFTFLGRSSPQIIIGTDGIGGFVGQAQIIQAEAAYNRLSVGCVQAAIPLGGPLVTCKIRPFILRSYQG